MNNYQFPKDFIWGTAASSYQIEGGYKEGGKGESIWDRFTHIPGNIKDGTTGNISCDFYHKYEEDIETMKKLGIPTFLLSISWPRIIPNGVGEINKEGIEFYRKVLTCLRKSGIKSYVVLYHWDLPQKLQEKGGWLNREIVDWFEEYSRVLYRELGDLVDNWITFCEPWVISLFCYWYGYHAPGNHDYSGALLAAHHLNLAHGSAVKAFRQSGLQGEIGIKLNLEMVYPADPDNEEDVEAAKRMTYQNNVLFCHPLLKGEYPLEFFDYLEKNGVVLPEILPGDMELISQEIDFFGLNCYSDKYVTKSDDWPIYAKTVDMGRQKTDFGWEFAPDSFYDIIKWLNDNYDLKKIIVAENGCASNDWIDEESKECQDPIRIIYLKEYLKRVHKAIAEGIPVKGYFVWSFFDNFEWAEGLSIRFGIVHIDYKTLKRTPKSSAYWYSETIKQNGF